jgi:hypothetical protein
LKLGDPALQEQLLVQRVAKLDVLARLAAVRRAARSRRAISGRRTAMSSSSSPCRRS